jgi:hypothetical protein
MTIDEMRASLTIEFQNICSRMKKDPDLEQSDRDTLDDVRRDMLDALDKAYEIGKGAPPDDQTEVLGHVLAGAIDEIRVKRLQKEAEDLARSSVLFDK